ncbi:MAG: alanine dehydrogenase [Gammaproteobacteria bacterium HGW-Gammaproteobacteria-1]|jgi:alanine dehydrogenase|nr:MAG: alanine dehydrogenase [Gammaproteobacteria bacterium HGW-Gammaproteobacteria-1]
MRIGIPREVKTLEGRVGLIPAAAAELVRAGHEVAVEREAGRLSGYADADYTAVGVSVLPDAAALYGWAQMVVKVKEPQPQEWPLLRADHLLFCYLHLAAEPALTAELLRIGLTGVAFETVEEADGRLPLLAPMSDIAGRIAAQAGAYLLTAPQGGKGILLGGLPAAERGHVVVLGAGVAGGSAAAVAAALGARVTVFDRNRDKLAAMRALGPNVTALHPYADAIEQAVVGADLLVGAVLIPGARAPHLVSAATVRRMEPGSVVVDISVDQGGCIETTRPTTWAAPTYVRENVLHFGVTNMPGSVPRTASQALSAALIPYAQRLAQGGWEAVPALARGVNVRGGEIVHPALKTM